MLLYEPCGVHELGSTCAVTLVGSVGSLLVRLHVCRTALCTYLITMLLHLQAPLVRKYAVLSAHQIEYMHMHGRQLRRVAMSSLERHSIAQQVTMGTHPNHK